MSARAQIVDRDRGWARMLKLARALAGGAYVKVGVLGDDENGGLHKEGEDLTEVEIAAVNEFGTEDGHVPERSFLRSTFDEQREKLQGMSQKFIAEILFGDMAVGEALGALGLELASEVKKKIQSDVPPPNAESTIRAKMSKGAAAKYFKHGPARNLGEALAQVGAAEAVKTLIDTGRLLNSINWAVVMNGSPAKGEGVNE